MDVTSHHSPLRSWKEQRVLHKSSTEMNKSDDADRKKRKLDSVAATTDETKQGEGTRTHTMADDPKEGEMTDSGVLGKSNKEFTDEADYFVEKKDLDGLKRLIGEIHLRVKHAEIRAAKGDFKELVFFVDLRSTVRTNIKSLEEEQAKANKQGSINRVADITDGLEEGLKHDFDLHEFQSRVLALFDWHSRERNEYMAPYFPIIQSSGTGKTRLFIELRKAINEPPEEDEGPWKNGDYECRTVICDGTDKTREEVKYFDLALQLTKKFDSKTERLSDEVRDQLRKLCFQECTKKNIVLLFDEAQFLIKHNEVPFRCIRWWLRQDDVVRQKNVVAVFAGTTSKLAKFYRDSPVTNYSRDPTATYVNWIEGDEKNPMKLYEPFYDIHTFGCFHDNAPPVSKEVSEFQRAAFFGRPLFAYLAKTNQLVVADDSNTLEGVITNPKLHAILQRMMLGHNWSENETALCSILGSRIQMGITTSFVVSSELVSQGYARLVHFDQGSHLNKATARVCFMADPVCAALAMGLMQTGWTLRPLAGDVGLTGKEQRFWSEKCSKLFTSGLCMPEKGNAGEIMTALYMLFCGDVLRYKEDKTLRTFSVSLLDWYKLMRTGKTQTAEAPCKNTTGMEVNFIQVCRNYFRGHSWTTQPMLEWMYDSATAIYVYPDCKAIDLVVAARGENADGKKFYHPVLVSVKCHLTMSKSEVDESIEKMKSLLEEVRESELTGSCPRALCLLVLIGAKKKPDKKAAPTDEAQSKPTLQETTTGRVTRSQQKAIDEEEEKRSEKEKLLDAENVFNRDDLGQFPNDDTFRMIVVPDDEFGISDAAFTLNQAQEKTEISASDSFLYGEPRTVDDNWLLLFRKSFHKNDFKDKFAQLFKIFSKK